MEMDGTMLIITTNYPEKLDRDRPGMIDMNVHFSQMKSKNIVEIFQHYYEMKILSEFSLFILTDVKLNPAEVAQVFLNNMHNPMEGLQSLITSNSLSNINLKSAQHNI